MSDVSRTTIVIVNWNGRDDTLACLDSIAAAAGGPWPVIVVDNGSNDDSVAAICAAYPAVNVIAAGANLGFTGGNNLGIHAALEDGAAFVFLLNNDTLVERSALVSLAGAANRLPDFGILTPLIYYADRKEELWFGGSRLDLARGEAVHDNSNPPDCSDEVRAIPWASGCAMLIRRELIDMLGGFDDRFFLNWEDVDLSIRTMNLGFRIGLVSDAQIYHKVGRSFASTSGAGTYYYVRNHLLLTELYARSRLAVFKVALGHLRQALRGIARREPDGWRSADVIREAIYDFVVGRFGQRRSSIS